MRKFGLLGKKLDYSHSKSFFTDLFAKNQIDASYDNIEVTDLSKWFEDKSFAEFSGFSVTIPYKTEIIPFLDELSDEAIAIGAVNTVKNVNGKLIGYNTDAFGFGQSIKPFLNNHHERAMILGTGGASKAIAYVLKNIGLSVIFISRNPKNNSEFGYESINENMVNACKMIVNCTSVGTFPDVDAKPNFPTDLISDKHLVVDLIYNPEKSLLLKESEKQGAIILNGYSMLQEQAKKAWEIWNQTT
jgi:shikimate dehydrogenase